MKKHNINNRKPDTSKEEVLSTGHVNRPNSDTDNDNLVNRKMIKGKPFVKYFPKKERKAFPDSHLETLRNLVLQDDLPYLDNPQESAPLDDPK